MIAHKGEFNLGLGMMAGFIAVFIFFWTPSFQGHNLLNFMDGLYNSISKNSAYYIPQTQKKVDEFKGKDVSMELKAKSEAAAERLGKMLQVNGMAVDRKGDTLKVQGDLGAVLTGVLKDAEAMYKNNDQELNAKYGFAGKQATYDWWTGLDIMAKNLTKHEQFKESKIVQNVMTKAVEPAYNYFGIQGQNIKDKWLLVTVSLVGYVIYTLWFGFAILFMFEGWGLKLEH
ncbi:MAG TPA: hypothetical protein DDY20_04845 [Desulfobulbaceae bacterium]|nr:hypothetical protein [Desulfobulbaceae bacterium]